MRNVARGFLLLAKGNRGFAGASGNRAVYKHHKSMRVKTILIAASPAAAETITEALGGIARTRTATTLGEAAAIIADGVDLIVAGTYFDGSRMFDLLRLVKECEEWRDIPSCACAA